MKNLKHAISEMLSYAQHDRKCRIYSITLTNLRFYRVQYYTMNKIKTITILAAMLLLMTVAGEVLLGVLFPGYAGKAHLAVPVFYLLLYAVPVAVMAQPADAKRFIKQFMVFKSLKMVLSIGALLAMCFLFREQATVVLVIFLIYTFAMMVVENIYVFRLKKRVIKNN